MKQYANDMQKFYNNNYTWKISKSYNGYKMTIDYLDGVTFTIKQVNADALHIKDEHGETIGYVFIGNDVWSDVPTLEEGFKKAVSSVIYHFNYYY